MPKHTMPPVPFAKRLDPFAKLGELEILLLCEFLVPIDIIRLQTVSHTWRHTLNSESVSRVALIHNFPHAPETALYKSFRARRLSTLTSEELANAGAAINFRRCVFREHARAMGTPTSIVHHLLKLDQNKEWDDARGYVAWLSEERYLYVQKVGDPRSKAKAVDYKNLITARRIPISRDDVEGARVNVQIGDGVVCVTLNIYVNRDEGYGAGRKALFLVFDIETLKFLWYQSIMEKDRLLGEVDTAKGWLAYIRKREVSFQEAHQVSLVVHELQTGVVRMEIKLERGHEIARGDLFFIVVSDSPFCRLIVLYEDHYTSNPIPEVPGKWTRIYSIQDDKIKPGTLLRERFLAHDEAGWFGPGGGSLGLNTDLYMDYPPRQQKFDIAESSFAKMIVPWGHLRQPPTVDEEGGPKDVFEDFLRLARNVPALGMPVPLLPQYIPFNAWSLDTHPQAGSVEFIHTRYLSELNTDRDFVPAWCPMDRHLQHQRVLFEPDRVPDICHRFEVFMPVEECSVVCTATAKERLRIEIASYTPADRDLWGIWGSNVHELSDRLTRYRSRLNPYSRSPTPLEDGDDESTRKKLETTKPHRLMKCVGRRPLNVARLVKETKSQCTVRSGKEVMPYEINEKGEIVLKGELTSCFLHHVQWSETNVAVRIRWVEESERGEEQGRVREDREDREDGEDANEEEEEEVFDGVVVFDFSAPW